MKFYRDWIEPRLLSKEILKCDRQVKYELQSAFDCQGKHYNAINYKSDFDLTFSDETFKVIDVKGMVKPEDKLKEKLFRYKYPDIVFEYRNFSKIDGGWILLDDILKARKQRKKLKQSKLKGEN